MLTDRLVAEAQRRWKARAERHLSLLSAEDTTRRSRAGEVAYLLEPDLKDGVGGLRDVQSLRWARTAGMRMLADDVNAVDAAALVLTNVRVALHRVSGRHSNVLTLDHQDAVASAARYADADELMAAVAGAGRTIAWVYEQSWGGHVRNQVKRHPRAQIAPGVELAHGSMELLGSASPADDPTLVLAVAIAAARHETPIGRSTLDRLRTELVPWADRYGPRWPAGALDELVALLLEGHRAIPVLETLDQAGLLSRILPEWQAVRSKPQRNAYHRFTVDRHLWETAANAAQLTSRVSRPDLFAPRRDVPRSRQGLPRGSHRRRCRAVRCDRCSSRPQRIRRRRCRPSRPQPSAPAIGGASTAISPTRRRSPRSPSRYAASTSWSCSTRSRSPIRSPPGRRPGRVGRRTSSRSSSIAPENGSTVPRPMVRRGSCSPMPTRWRRWPPTASRCCIRRRPGHGGVDRRARRRSPASPVRCRCADSTCSARGRHPSGGAAEQVGWAPRSSACCRPAQSTTGGHRHGRAGARRRAGDRGSCRRSGTLDPQASPAAGRAAVPADDRLPRRRVTRLDRDRGARADRGRTPPPFWHDALGDVGLDIRHATVQHDRSRRARHVLCP